MACRVSSASVAFNTAFSIVSSVTVFRHDEYFVP
jgi:hypothetical protein